MVSGTGNAGPEVYLGQRQRAVPTSRVRAAVRRGRLHRGLGHVSGRVGLAAHSRATCCGAAARGRRLGRSGGLGGDAQHQPVLGQGLVDDVPVELGHGRRRPPHRQDAQGERVLPAPALLGPLPGEGRAAGGRLLQGCVAAAVLSRERSVPAVRLELDLHCHPVCGPFRQEAGLVHPVLAVLPPGSFHQESQAGGSGQDEQVGAIAEALDCLIGRVILPHHRPAGLDEVPPLGTRHRDREAGVPPPWLGHPNSLGVRRPCSYSTVSDGRTNTMQAVAAKSRPGHRRNPVESEAARSGIRSGGRPGLQNRCWAVVPSRVGSIPTPLRHLYAPQCSAARRGAGGVLVAEHVVWPYRCVVRGAFGFNLV